MSQTRHAYAEKHPHLPHAGCACGWSAPEPAPSHIAAYSQYLDHAGRPAATR